jgi:hypothetical protein
LLIEEAYYGLADHIYALDSHREGYENFKKPTSIEEWIKMQLIPMRKKL